MEKLEYKRWSWQERGLLFPDLTFHSSFPKSLLEGVVSTVINKATVIQESQRPEHPLQSFFLPQRSLEATQTTPTPPGPTVWGEVRTQAGPEEWGETWRLASSQDENGDQGPARYTAGSSSVAMVMD